MPVEIPAPCFVSVPLEVSGPWVTESPEKVNLLFQAQWAARSAVSLDDAFGLLLDLAEPLVPADGAAVVWRGGLEGTGAVHQARGLAVQREESFRRLAEALAGRRSHPLLLDEGRAARAAWELLEPFGATGLVAVPIGGSGRSWGLLVLLRGQSGGGFSEDEARILRLLALSFEPVLEDLATGDRTKELAFVDRLTGAFTRRYFDQHFRGEVARANRSQTPMALLLMEIDQVPAVRNRQGPAVADALLQAVVRRVDEARRQSDTLARIERERFAIILPGAGQDHVAVLARRLFGALAPPLIPDLVPGGGIRVNPHMGAAVLPDHGDTAETLWKRALASLEEARGMSGRRYYAPPRPEQDPGDRLLDRLAAQSLVGRPGEPGVLLAWIARLCREVVPADRVSLMERDDGHLVVQEAFGFEGRDQVIRTTRVSLDSESVSGWVARHRRPLLVPDDTTIEEVPANRVGGYRSDSFLSVPLIAEGDLEGVVHFSNRSDGGVFTREDMERFLPVADRIAQVLRSCRRFSSDRQGFLRESLAYLVDMVEDMIPGMGGHSLTVAQWAGRLARALGWDEEVVERIAASARFHDLGEASFRVHRLAEARPFGPRERRDLTEHPLLGWRFLESLGMKGLDRDAIVYHHEREDGSGYMGRKGDQIPPAAKIVAVAEAFVGLTSPRPYRGAVPIREAVARLEAEAFDPDVVACLRKMVTDSAP